MLCFQFHCSLYFSTLIAYSLLYSHSNQSGTSAETHSAETLILNQAHSHGAEHRPPRAMSHDPCTQHAHRFAAPQLLGSPPTDRSWRRRNAPTRRGIHSLCACAGSDLSPARPTRGWLACYTRAITLPLLRLCAQHSATAHTRARKGQLHAPGSASAMLRF